MSKPTRLVLGVVIELLSMYLIYNTAMSFELSESVMSIVILCIKGHIMLFMSLLIMGMFREAGNEIF